MPKLLVRHGSPCKATSLKSGRPDNLLLLVSNSKSDIWHSACPVHSTLLWISSKARLIVFSWFRSCWTFSSRNTAISLFNCARLCSKAAIFSSIRWSTSLSDSKALTSTCFFTSDTKRIDLWRPDNFCFASSRPCWIASLSLALAFRMDMYLWFLWPSLTTQFLQTTSLQVWHKNLASSAGWSLQEGSLPEAIWLPSCNRLLFLWEY